MMDEPSTMMSSPSPPRSENFEDVVALIFNQNDTALASASSAASSSSRIPSSKRDDPISNETLHLIHMVMTGVWYSICFTGIATNCINVRTFLRVGLEDSVTVSLFTLAISDLSLCSVAVLELTTFFADVLGRQYSIFFYLPPLIVTLYLMCVRRIFTTTTVIITTFLAVQRCLCVALPFKVKGMFTRLRTAVFFAVVFCLDATVHLLFLSQHPTFVTTVPGTNESQIGLTVPSSSEPVPFIIEIVIGIGMNISCQAIVIMCLVVMGIHLRRSVEFKKSATAATVYSAAAEAPRSKNTQSDGSDAAAASKKTNTKASSAKEHQAMMQVGLVSIIFVASNIPLLTFGVVSIAMPEIAMYGEFHNVYHFIQNIMYTAELLNSSVNLVVYYNYNTKFRNSCFLNPKRTSDAGGKQ